MISMRDLPQGFFQSIFQRTLRWTLQNGGRPVTDIKHIECFFDWLGRHLPKERTARLSLLLPLFYFFPTLFFFVFFYV
jgi:hypothetical protein